MALTNRCQWLGSLILFFVCVLLISADNSSPPAVDQPCTSNLAGTPSCNFDKGMCSYKSFSDNGESLQWARSDGEMGLIAGDWQSNKDKKGSYVYLDVSDPSVPLNARAVLIGQLSTGISAVCIEIHYATSGSQNHSLRIYNQQTHTSLSLTDRLIGELKDVNTGGQWQVAHFASCVAYASYIAFESEKVSSISTIALDYVAIRISTMTCQDTIPSKLTTPRTTFNVTKMSHTAAPRTTTNTTSATFYNTTTTSTSATPDITTLTHAQTSPSSARHDLECHLTSMTVHIPVSLAPNAKLILRDPKCELINNGTHHIISFAYDTCGTSMTFFDDYIYAENDVTVHVEVNGGSSVVFDSDYKIPIVCRTEASHKVEGSFQTWTREPIKEESTDLTVSSFVLREFKTSLYQEEITSSAVEIPLNREMYVELALNNSKAKSFGVKVNQCIATPSSDPSDPIRFELINNGCPATQAVHIQYRPAPDRYRFSVQAFHFQGIFNQDNLVFIHCDVSLCPVLTCDVICDGKRRIRKRRNLRLKRSSVTLTSRPHLVVHDLD